MQNDETFCLLPCAFSIFPYALCIFHSAFSKRLLRLVAATAGVLVLFLLVVACTVALLPTFLSTPWLKGLAEIKLSQAVNREVRIQTILWTWAGGILVKGMAVEDDPDFSDQPIAVICKVRIRTSLLGLLEDRLDLEVVVDGLSVNVIRKADGSDNVGAFLAGLPDGGSADNDTSGRKGTALSLPLDVNARVHFRWMTLKVEDRSLGSRMALTDGELLLNIPSLSKAPVNLTAGAKLTLDGRNMPPLKLDASVSHLFDADHNLTIDQVQAEIQGQLPGVRMKMTGNLDAQTPGISSHLLVDLPDFFNMARPLLPPGLSSMMPRGSLALALDANQIKPSAADQLRNGTGLNLSATLEGRGLAVAGLPFSGMGDDGSVKGPSLGPLDFSFEHQGTLDMADGNFLIKKGSLGLMKETRLAWQGEVRQAFGGNPEMDLHVGPVAIDFREILKLAAPFLSLNNAAPPGPAIQTNGRLTLGSLTLSGESGEGPLDALAHNLELTIPRLTMDEMAISDAVVSVNSLQALLIKGFPYALSASIRGKVGEYRQGRAGVVVSGVNLTNLAINAENLYPAEKALPGVSGRVNADVALSVAQCDLPTKLGDISLDLSAQANSNADRTLDLMVEKSDLKIADLRLQNPKLATRAYLGVSGGLGIQGNDATSLTLDGLACRLDLGDMASIRLNTSGAPYKRMAADINAAVNLTRFQQAFPDLLGGKTVKGRVEVAATLDGRVPNVDELAGLSDPSGFDLKQRLAFLRDLSVLADLDEVTVTLPQPSGKLLSIGPLETEKPLSYQLSTASGQGELSTEVLIQKIQGVPQALDRFVGAFPSRLSFTLRHNGVQSARIDQRFAIPSLPLKHDLSISMGGLDRVLTSGLDKPPALWLKWLGGTIKERVTLGPGLKADNLFPGLNFEGELSLGIDTVLESGKRVTADLSLETDGMVLGLKDGFSLEGLQTNLNIKKNYRLGFPSSFPRWSVGTIKGAATPDALPLSVSVITADADRTPSVGSGASGRFMERLRRRYSAEHAVFFDLALARLFSGLSLEIGPAMMDFGLKGGLPGSEFFQADVLGGTVMGAVGLARDAGGFYLRTDVAFTGIDSRRLVTGGMSGVSGTEGEIGGELSLRLPLVTQMRPFLSGLQLTASVSPIGSRALERFLYALDPYESNESIVGQRRMLRQGTPRWVKLGIQNGALSLTGEVLVSGTRVAIPPIDRLNIENIGGLRRYESTLSGIEPVIGLLEILAAETLVVDGEGRVGFK